MVWSIMMANQKYIDFATDADLQDFELAIERGGLRVRRTARLAGWSLAFFILATTVMLSLTNIGPFHVYWARFGLFALLLDGISLVASIYSLPLLWAAWSIRRATQRDLKELIDDRYGVVEK
jgi:hypothetical protein